VTAEKTALGVSLWLVPDGDADHLLSGRIRSLASLHGSTPFPPHLTLLGGLTEGEAEILATATRLARQTPPLTVRLVAATVRDEYFRRLVLEAEPSPPLTAARERAAMALATPACGFEPHLSLLYGRAPVAAEDADIELPLVFTCRQLAAWRTLGPVAEWRALGRWPLEAR
jgi:hypothetical protein